MAPISNQAQLATFSQDSGIIENPLLSDSDLQEPPMSSFTDSYRISLFDAFRIERNGETISFLRNRRPDALLAYLALNPGVPHLRTTIGETLWPGKSVAHQRNRLSEVIFRMKMLFEEIGLPEEFVLTPRRVLQLSPYVQTDIADFHNLIQRISKARNPHTRQDLLGELTNLYGSGIAPLIIDPWIDEERQKLHALYNQTIQQYEHVLAGSEEGPGRSLLHDEFPPLQLHQPAQPRDGSSLDHNDPEEKTILDAIHFAEEAELYLWGSSRPTWIKKVTDKLDLLVSTSQAAIDRDDLRSAARILGCIWPVWTHTGDPALLTKGRILLGNLLDILSPEITATYGRVLHGASILELEAGSPLEMVRPRMERALRLWEELGNRVWYARALSSLGIIARRQSQPKEAQMHFAESLAVFRSLNEPDLMVGAFQNAANLELSLGNLPQAKALLIEALAIARTHDDIPMESRLLLNMSTLYMHDGNWDRALSIAQDSFEKLTAIDDSLGRGSALRHLGYIYTEQGHLREAQSHLEESVSIFAKTRKMRDMAESLHYLSSAQIAMGETRQAEISLMRAQDIYYSLNAFSEAQEVDQDLSDLRSKATGRE